MGCMHNSNDKIDDNKFRKLYIDLLSENTIQQPENFCSNQIKTTRYTM